jgi:glycosyltransferase involved in cell wall biosynthesis
MEGMNNQAEIRVIYNGVDIDLFSPSLQTNKTSMKILSVGNLIPIKGHELVLYAVKQLSKKYPTIQYEVIGEGPMRSYLIRLTEELGISDRVKFLGRRTRYEVAEAMKRCMVFALPSHYEGLGCVYLEAMASGKPVIACRGQGIEEIINHGENGLLVGPNNLDELIETLSKLFEDFDFRERLGQEGRKTVEERLTLTHQAGQLYRVFQECIS